MPTDTSRLRSADTTLAHAVAGAVDSLTLSPEDGAAVRLARHYADAIDQADDPGKALEVLGPKLLAVLDALCATPAARARVVKGVVPGGPTRLQILRDARR